ncbi:MAG TPA: hypothetical protein VJ724_07355, partial [Tahibacter sp.]|nr:hypothetical protein [Tahibacter sp.]
GSFNDWSGVGAPDNWTFVAGGTGLLQRKAYTAGTGQPVQNWSLQMSTTETFNPIAGQTGSYLRYDGAWLMPGKRYRISFMYVRANGNPPETNPGISFGLYVRSDLLRTTVGAISPEGQPLFGTASSGTAGGERQSLIYEVPPGERRKLYFIASSSQTMFGIGNGSALVQFHDVRVELLGDVVQTLPVEGITLAGYMRAIFERYGGLAPSEWSVDDCASIDAETGYRIGVHLREPTTVADAARLVLDTYCAVQYTDAAGVICTRRLRDPSRAKSFDIVYEFGEHNIEYGISTDVDLAPGLTTSIGARRNWTTFNESDFVTDYDAVPAALRMQFQRTSQLHLVAAGSVSDTYLHAAQAPPLDSLLDSPDAAQREINERVAPYAGGTTDLLTRALTRTLPRFVTFSALYDGPPPQLHFGDIVRLKYPRFGFDAGVAVAVWDVTVEPARKRLTITAWSTR